MIKKILIIFASFCAINLIASEMPFGDPNARRRRAKEVRIEQVTAPKEVKLTSAQILARRRLSSPSSPFEPISETDTSRSSRMQPPKRHGLARRTTSAPVHPKISILEEDEEEEEEGRSASAPALSEIEIKIEKLKEELINLSRENNYTPTLTHEDLRKQLRDPHQKEHRLEKTTDMIRVELLEAKIQELTAWKQSKKPSRKAKRNVSFQTPLVLTPPDSASITPLPVDEKEQKIEDSDVRKFQECMDYYADEKSRSMQHALARFLFRGTYGRMPFEGYSIDRNSRVYLEILNNLIDKAEQEVEKERLDKNFLFNPEKMKELTKIADGVYIKEYLMPE